MKKKAMKARIHALEQELDSLTNALQGSIVLIPKADPEPAFTKVDRASFAKQAKKIEALLDAADKAGFGIEMFPVMPCGYACNDVCPFEQIEDDEAILFKWHNLKDALVNFFVLGLELNQEEEELLRMAIDQTPFQQLEQFIQVLKEQGKVGQELAKKIENNSLCICLPK